MGTRISGKISDILGNFDYMAHWGALKTREELIGKPLKYYVKGDIRTSVIIGKIVDCDPTADTWWAETVL